MLSSLIFYPIVAAVAILILPRRFERQIKWVALLTTLIVLLKSIVLLRGFDQTQIGFQFVEKSLWIAPINVFYFLGVDGISIALVFLTALLGFIACLASWGITKNIKEYFILYLILMTGMMGTFLALDLFLFYIFWELVLIPMYFLIGIWGGPRKEYAAGKFFLYTLAGSVLMLLGILTVYFKNPIHTFNMVEIARTAPFFDLNTQILLFLSFFIAFAIKVPIFPFHTWLPDAHVEAPTPISVLLAGVLLKMGGYGLFRICVPMFPKALSYFAYSIAVLGMINIVYGAFVAMAQTDFKKMIAYSSVSHMGFVLLGLASLNVVGFNGSLLEMFNHGIITGAMFLLVGVLYDRAHTRDLSRFGGLSANMPVYAFFLTVSALASLGLPGLSGFVGEFMSLFGAFGSMPKLVILSTLGLVVTALYFLIMVKKVLLGPVNSSGVQYGDMTIREIITVVPLVLITVIVGVCPLIVIKFQDIAIHALVRIF